MNMGTLTMAPVSSVAGFVPEFLRWSFATGSVSTMACNWVETVRRSGCDAVLIGALDQQMMDACEANNVPCILIDGGAITKALSDRRSGNVRNDPAIYPKMSVLKVGFYRELLSFGASATLHA